MYKPQKNSGKFNVKKELEGRLEATREDGLVDSHAMLNVNNHSSTRELIIVPNNILRIRESGAKPVFSTH